MTRTPLQDAFIEAMAEAALGGHDLTPFVPVIDDGGIMRGYEAE